MCVCVCGGGTKVSIIIIFIPGYNYSAHVDTVQRVIFVWWKFSYLEHPKLKCVSIYTIGSTSLF